MVSCIKHGGLVPERNAHLVGWDDTGSGPGVAHYACTPCVRDHGLVPLTTTRRDPAPVPPGDTA